MKLTFQTIFLIAGLSGFGLATQAQTVVWQDDFQSSALGSSSDSGTYGAVAFDYNGTTGNPAVIITNDLVEGTNLQNCAMIFSPSGGASYNFGLELNFLPTMSNTDTTLSDYTLEFDVAVQGDPLNTLGGGGEQSLGIYQQGSGEYYGDGLQQDFPFPAPGTGYQHYALNLGSFGTAHGQGLLDPTFSPITFFIAIYSGNPTNTDTEEIDLQDVEIVVTNTPAPIPPPVMSIVKANPGLRFFCHNSSAPYNTEGMVAQDENQSWVGSTPGSPPTYTVNFEDWGNTVAGFTFQEEFFPNNYFPPGTTGGGDAYVGYYESNSFVLTITQTGSSYTGSIDWRTNSSTGANTNNVLLITNAVGVGPWTLIFSNDTSGALTAPGAKPVGFTLPAAMAAQFANPLTLCYSISPNVTNGYGTYMDLKSISVTNVAGVNEVDDFTQDTYDSTSPATVGMFGLWDTTYSLDADSLVQVGSNTPYWVTWTYPARGYNLITSTNLSTPPAEWFTPGYYDGYTPVTTTLMGKVLFWTLLDTGDLPTVDGNQGSPVANTGYFLLTTNTPSQ